MKHAVKNAFEDMPEIIRVPEEFVHKKCAVIFTEFDDEEVAAKPVFEDFYGALPDSPERPPEGNYENREVL